MQFDIGMLFVVIGISTYSPNTCYRIKYKNKKGKKGSITVRGKRAFHCCAGGMLSGKKLVAVCFRRGFGAWGAGAQELITQAHCFYHHPR
jgi:hypothetical protein